LQFRIISVNIKGFTPVRKVLGGGTAWRGKGLIEPEPLHACTLFRANSVMPRVGRRGLVVAKIDTLKLVLIPCGISSFNHMNQS
jgi:hypothetical protein